MMASTRWRETLAALHADLLAAECCDVFARPVNPEVDDVPGYGAVVRSPMDLAAMNKKIEAQVYGSPLQYRGDLDLIISNSRLYNTRRGSQILRLTTQAEKLFNKLFAKYFPEEASTLLAQLPPLQTRSSRSSSSEAVSQGSLASNPPLLPHRRRRRQLSPTIGSRSERRHAIGFPRDREPSVSSSHHSIGVQLPNEQVDDNKIVDGDIDRGGGSGGDAIKKDQLHDRHREETPAQDESIPLRVRPIASVSANTAESATNCVRSSPSCLVNNPSHSSQPAMPAVCSTSGAEAAALVLPVCSMQPSSGNTEACSDPPSQSLRCSSQDSVSLNLSSAPAPCIILPVPITAATASSSSPNLITPPEPLPPLSRDTSFDYGCSPSLVSPVHCTPPQPPPVLIMDISSSPDLWSPNRLLLTPDARTTVQPLVRSVLVDVMSHDGKHAMPESSYALRESARMEIALAPTIIVASSSASSSSSSSAPAIVAAAAAAAAAAAVTSGSFMPSIVSRSLDEEGCSGVSPAINTVIMAPMTSVSNDHLAGQSTEDPSENDIVPASPAKKAKRKTLLTDSPVPSDITPSPKRQKKSPLNTNKERPLCPTAALAIALPCCSPNADSENDPLCATVAISAHSAHTNATSMEMKDEEGGDREHVAQQSRFDSQASVSQPLEVPAMAEPAVPAVSEKEEDPTLLEDPVCLLVESTPLIPPGTPPKRPHSQVARTKRTAKTMLAAGAAEPPEGPPCVESSMEGATTLAVAHSIAAVASICTTAQKPRAVGATRKSTSAKQGAKKASKKQSAPLSTNDDTTKPQKSTKQSRTAEKKDDDDDDDDDEEVPARPSTEAEKLARREARAAQLAAWKTREIGELRARRYAERAGVQPPRVPRIQFAEEPHVFE